MSAVLIVLMSSPWLLAITLAFAALGFVVFLGMLVVLFNVARGHWS